MNNVVQGNDEHKWLRPWNIEKFDDLYNRDERFFSILIKGALSWLTSNLVLYNKPINHFIFNTGSSYLYVESNGYQFSMNETFGEDQMYMKMPRCVIEIGEINIPTEELSAPYVRGVYERRDGNEIKGYNAQIRRMPIELTLTAKYVLSNFNESMILIQELIDKVAWQQYFNIIYLGQIINCSIELDSNYRIEVNKIDMADPNTNQKNIEITYKLCSNYPCIDETTSIENKQIIESFRNNTHLISDKNIYNVTDTTVRHINENGSVTIDNDIEFNNPKDYLSTTKDGDTFTMGDIDKDKEASILQYKNDTLLKTTFSELKNTL